MRAIHLSPSGPPTLLAGLLLAAGCNVAQSSAPAGSPAEFRLTLLPEAGVPATLRGDSATWRNDGSPFHRAFRLELRASASTAGYPPGPVLLMLLGNDSVLSVGSEPVPGVYPVNPVEPVRGTSVDVRIGEGWRGVAIDGSLTVARIRRGIVTGSLDLLLSVREDLEVRPDVVLRGEFTAVALEE